MVMAVVSRDQADRVLERLVAAGFGATFTESRGGMLRQAQKMLFVAAPAESVDDVLGIIKSACRTSVAVTSHPSPVSGGQASDVRTGAASVTEVGYAVVFVWDLDRFETY
jgi:uncharacterized protein YaaQ